MVLQTCLLKQILIISPLLFLHSRAVRQPKTEIGKGGGHAGKDHGLEMKAAAEDSASVREEGGCKQCLNVFTI